MYIGIIGEYQIPLVVVACFNEAMARTSLREALSSSGEVVARLLLITVQSTCSGVVNNQRVCVVYVKGLDGRILEYPPEPEDAVNGGSLREQLLPDFHEGEIRVR